MERKVETYPVGRIRGTSDGHSLIPPCQVACPLHMAIGEYVDLVAQGKVLEALHVIRDGNPFPSICAYVCTHPCEDACRRSQVDKPVAIRALKRFAVEFGGDRMIQLEADTTQSEKVAVVGSGPAGLACAYYLRKLGYPVTVFEAYSELGGMLRVGIPQYRLPRDVVDTEVQRLIHMGVEIKANTRVISLDLLFDIGYKAIFITVGAHQSLRMGIEGEESPGVIDGATFLREVNLGLRPSLGERVAIVGGGNVAMDAARAAVRLGAEKVSILYRRSRAEMPASPDEIEQALEEGVEIMFLVAPTQVKRGNGRLSVTCAKMELGEIDMGGRRRPVPIEGSEFGMEFDTLITAIGQAPHLSDNFRLRLGRGSTIQVDPLTLTTNRTGVYAGGDAVTGPATVTQALASGRQAAFRIDDFLRHRYPMVNKETGEALTGELLPKTIEMIRRTERLEPPLLPPEARLKEFKAVELIYDWQAAVNEARRCLRCGMGAELLFQDKCATCLTCLRVCPYHVPYLDDGGTIQIPAEQCQACGICVAECPARAITLRKPDHRRQIDEELEHALKSATVPDLAREKSKPLIIGFCCQYGLFGTGALASLWRGSKAGIQIVPVLCVAKLEEGHILRAFEMGAEGVFIAGCGEQCSRENTAFWVLQRVERIRRALSEIGLEPARLQALNLRPADEDPAGALDSFTERIGGLCLASVLKQEVKS
ncbi:MAG: FAD-dependent oxidoreductase [Dehalococcoidia bacterium]